jgi:hypothetical protein
MGKLSLFALPVAVPIGLVLLLVFAQPSGASQAFSPSFNVALSSSQPGKVSGVYITMQIAAGQHPLDSMSIFPAPGWSITRGRDIPNGDRIGVATITADIGCDGVVETLPSFTLVNAPVSDPGTKAEWVTSGTSWEFRLVVDELQPLEHEISVVLANGSMPFPICTPQKLLLLVNAHSQPGNVPIMINPVQPGMYTWSAIFVSLGLEHVHLASRNVGIGTQTPVPTATPVPSATPSPTPVGTPAATDLDGDGIPNDIELGCGSLPGNANSRPERVDGVFAGADEDGDTQLDEALPAGADQYDCDRDGFNGAVEKHVYAPSFRGDQDPCGTNSSPPTSPPSPIGWPADLKGGTLTANKVTVEDLATFVAPIRYLGTNVGMRVGDVRWDLSPGKGPFGSDINVQDFATLLVSAPMLGTRAFNGPPCPWP